MLMVTGFGDERGVLSGHALCRSFSQPYLLPQVLIYTLHILKLCLPARLSLAHTFENFLPRLIIFCQEAINTVSHLRELYKNSIETVFLCISLAAINTPRVSCLSELSHISLSNG